MRVCTIASGSSGNCTYVGSDNTHILIDAGISGKKIEKGLEEAEIKPNELSGILVTHEHIDHINGLGVMARRYGIPIYTSSKTYEAVTATAKVGNIPDGLFRSIEADTPFIIGDLGIDPFSTSHDAADPMGFRVELNGKAFASATDLGYYNDYIVSKLKNLDVLLIESNHDVNMLEAGAYPYQLKRRILGDKGHLSNSTAGLLLNEILHDGMKHIMLGHLSKENNYPALAFQTVCYEITFGKCKYKAEDFSMEIAKRDEAGQVIEW